MQVTLDNAFDWQDIEQLPGGSAAERCKAIFNHLIAGGSQYPGITRAHFYDLLAEGHYDSLAVERLNGFMARLAEDMQAKGADLPPAELRLACAQVAAASMLMILAPRLFDAGLGIDLTDGPTRQAFVERLVDKLIEQ